MIESFVSEYLHLTISNTKTSSCLYSFLTSEDLISLCQSNKKINTSIDLSNELIYKEMKSKTKTLGEIIFKKELFFNRANQNIAEQMWMHTDKIYKQFSDTNKKIVQIYFFSLYVLLVNVSSLLLALGFKQLQNVSEAVIPWIIFSPCLVEWIISIIVLIVYRCRLRVIKKKVKSIVEKNKVKMLGVTKEKIEEMCKNLKLRTKYCKHNVFENWLNAIIIFFIPFILKVTVFAENKCVDFFLVSSSLFYIVMFVTEVSKFIKIKWKSWSNRLSYYRKNYTSNPKLQIIEKKLAENYSYLSESAMNTLFFIIKIIFGFLFVVYFTQIGAKIDDPVNGSSWVILFIPFYILYLPIIGYSILHCYSLFPLFKKEIWKIIITLVLFIITLFSNLVIIPMRMENRIALNPFWIPGLFLFGTICISLHIFVVSKRIED